MWEAVQAAPAGSRTAAYTVAVLTADDPLPLRPRRIAVVGVSGAGKTTLSDRIAEVIDAPRTETDSLYHGPEWTVRPEFLDDVRAAVARDSWVMEFQYRAARPIIAARMDLLVWLDPPFWTTTLPRVVRRTVHRRLTRHRMWSDNQEGPLWTFFTDPNHIVRWSLQTRHKYRDTIEELAEAKGWTVVRLRSQREVERWLSGPLAAAVSAP